MYEILIEPDSYWIFVKKFGYTTMKKMILAKPGEMVLKYSLAKSEVYRVIYIVLGIFLRGLEGLEYVVVHQSTAYECTTVEFDGSPEQ